MQKQMKGTGEAQTVPNIPVAPQPKTAPAPVPPVAPRTEKPERELPDACPYGREGASPWCSTEKAEVLWFNMFWCPSF